jgi:hypothetical protein
MRLYLLCTGSTKTLLAREIESRQGLTAVGKQQGGLTKGHDEYVTYTQHSQMSEPVGGIP